MFSRLEQATDIQTLSACFYASKVWELPESLVCQGLQVVKEY
jgi:hypothetical protein